MAKKSHPYIEALKLSAVVFGTTILIIVFLALYITAVVRESRVVEPSRAEQNITPPGKLYLQ